jgi:hypothetical protein
MQNVRERDWHLSVNSSLLKMKAVRYYKHARPLTTLPNKEQNFPEHFTIQEKCAFKPHGTENKSLFFRWLYILHRFAVTGGEVLVEGIMNHLTHSALHFYLIRDRLTLLLSADCSF